MAGRWRMMVVVTVGACALVLGGCGDDGPAKSTPTKSAPTSISAGGNVTPFPTPLINGNQLSSPTKGYSATLPDGWKVHPNLIQTVDASADAFFEPLKEGAKVQANIAVNCIVIKAADQAKRVEALKTNTARQGLNKDIQESTRKIAGLDATVLTYRFVSQQDAGIELDKQDVIFSNNKCDWTITTATKAGDRAAYQPTFDAFLDSFKLLP